MSTAKGKRGQTLTFLERKTVLDVLEHFLQTMNKSQAVEACSRATGRSPRIIYKLAKERENGSLKPPTNRKRPHTKSHSRLIKYSDNIRSKIRQIVHTCFINHISPILNTILSLVNEEKELPTFRKGTLYTLLKEIGFTYEKRGTKGIFVENKHIIHSRHEYLKQIKAARSRNKSVVYTGVKWLNLHNLRWKNSDDESCSAKTVSLGLLVACTEICFVNYTGLPILWEKNKVTLEFTTTTNKDWIINSVLPVCPENSLVVVNPSSNDPLPDKLWPKNDLIKWLERRSIELSSTDLLPHELLKLVDNINDKSEFYGLDGIHVIQLPPSHPELNLAHYILNSVEEHVKLKSSFTNMEDVTHLIHEAFNGIKVNDLSSCMNMVKNSEDFLWKINCLQEDVEELIYSVSMQTVNKDNNQELNFQN